MRKSTPIITAVRFEVDDKLVVADPCYVDTDDGDAPEQVVERVIGPSELGVVLDDCAGEWLGEIEIENAGSWGDRVSVLRLTRRDARPDWHQAREGVNGVDSGQMWAGCASNLPLDYERLLETDPDPNSGDFPCRAAEGGIVSSTGYGDGSYPVYVWRDQDDRPVKVEVRFLEEDEEGE